MTMSMTNQSEVKQPEKTSREILDEEYSKSDKNGNNEDYYRNEIDKLYKNFIIIFQYLKNLSYYPEFEYSGLLDKEEMERWEKILEQMQAKKEYLDNNTGKIYELKDFYREIETNFFTIYKYNIRQYLKILKFKLEDIYQYLDVQQDGDMLALQSFNRPGGDDVISLYDIKREAMNIIYNKLDKFGKNVDMINRKNINVYNNFLEKTKQFISEFSYYETDGMDRNILFNFINEIYTIIPD
jgi:hypothetical protein